MSIIYETEDFRKIMFDGNSDYILPETTMAIIQLLCKEIGYSQGNTRQTYVNQYNAQKMQTNNTHSGNNNYKSKDKVYREKGQHKKEEESWKVVSTFQTTKFASVEGIQIVLNDIRVAINKMTDKNFIEKMEFFIDKINAIRSENCEDQTENINTIYNTIYKIASGNKTYSELYAHLFIHLYNNDPITMKQFLEDKIIEYMDSMNNIIDVSSDDYDNFCDFNTKNTVRKNIGAMFSHIAKSNQIPNLNLIRIIEMIDTIFSKIETNIEDKDKSKETDEITENLVILFSNLKSELKDVLIVKKTLLQKWVAYKTGEKPGLSNRTKFKYMDLIGK